MAFLFGMLFTTIITVPPPQFETNPYPTSRTRLKPKTLSSGLPRFSSFAMDDRKR